MALLTNPQLNHDGYAALQQAFENMNKWFFPKMQMSLSPFSADVFSVKLNCTMFLGILYSVNKLLMWYICKYAIEDHIGLLASLLSRFCRWRQNDGPATSRFAYVTIKSSIVVFANDTNMLSRHLIRQTFQHTITIFITLPYVFVMKKLGARMSIQFRGDWG